ncbi:MAG: PIN domain-containing protein [Armatimonadetes bacterium]|nr:PIN domain-containing protein [Armatimonadota bacterium]
MSQAFVDTNILLYSVDARYPRERALAQALIRELSLAGELVISAQVLSEFCAVIRRGKLPDVSVAVDLASYVDSLCAAAKVVDVTAGVVADAVRIGVAHGMSHHDAQIPAAAAIAGCGVIYTDDLQGAPAIGGIRYTNPLTHASDD